MKTTVFDFIAELESDIAQFYQKLNALSRLAQSTELFTFMSEHSQGHSQTVTMLSKKYTKPQLDNSLIRSVHEQIKNSLMQEIQGAEDMSTAMTKIARAEELVGKMYKMMSKYYADLAIYYSSIEAEINLIAEEEFIHRDMVKKESLKYLK